MLIAIAAFILTVLASGSAKVYLGAGPHHFDYLLGEDSDFGTYVDVVFLDYDLDKETIQDIKAEGKTVICYVNVGAWEEWRSDAWDFPEYVLGNDYEGWPGERWFDVRKTSVLIPLMIRRFQTALSKGCDGIDPDNMNGFEVDTGFNINYNDQLVYNRAIGEAIRNLDMLAGLKNDGYQAADLVDSFDFVVSESCAPYDECDAYSVFIDQDKPVFVIEYTDLWDTQDFFDYACPIGERLGFAFILKHYELHNDFLEACL
jgi:hypothetical protein